MKITAAKANEGVVFQIRYVIGEDNVNPQYGRISLPYLDPSDPEFKDPLTVADMEALVAAEVDVDALEAASLVPKVTDDYELV